MHRRTFLATAGAASLAGCASGGRPGEGSTLVSTPASTPPPGGTDSSSTTPSDPVGRPLKGVSLSPRSFEGGDFQSFFEEAGEAGALVRWAGDWADLGEADGAPAVVETLARQHGMEPVVETGVFSASSRTLFRPLSSETRERYVESAATFCEAHAPPYLGIGVEIDFHYETDPESFETFVDLFATTYDAVKAASPGTQVYTGFQLERLRGLRGGLFGGENDPESATWELLERFPKADLVGVTTYPGLIYGNPDEIPDDYYAELDERAGRPVAITETGWSQESKGEGWVSDEAEQAAFVDRLLALTADVDVETLLWVWLYEQADESGAFSGMSLRREDGSARPAWDAWVGDPESERLAFAT